MLKKTLAFFFTAFLTAACANIECPLDNVVAMQVGFYNSLDGNKMSVTYELNVYSSPKDSLLLNQAQNVNSFLVPLRHGVETDTLVLHFSDATHAAADTLLVSKVDIPHFESVDCPTAFFHQLMGVAWTSHPLAELPLTIDSVVVVSPKVDYEDRENIRVYLRTVATEL